MKAKLASSNRLLVGIRVRVRVRVRFPNTKVILASVVLMLWKVVHIFS